MEFRNLGKQRPEDLARSPTATGSPTARQVEEDAALACVRHALDEGITTFDTADVYANTEAEAVLGKALQGERREGLEIFTKVYWPTGPGAQRPRPVAQAHHGVDRRLAAPARTDYVDLYQAHRYDYETPLEETMEAFADVVQRRQGALHRRLGVARRGDPGGARAGPRAAHPARLQPAAVQHALAGHRGRGGARPAEELGIGQVVFSPIAQGVLTGKYKPGQAAARGLPGHRREAAAPTSSRAG